jgi:hypothetical protein
MTRFSRSALVVAALVAAFAAVPSAGRAQQSGDGFLFGAPQGSFTLRGGWALARANSDLFSFTTRQLTLNRSDFSSPELGADFAIRVLSRTEVVLASSVAGVSKGSEFRGFIDNNNAPIQQHTWFTRVPVTLSVKQYLTSTGRSIGQFAWIPARLAPYVGAGGGMM